MRVVDAVVIAGALGATWGVLAARALRAWLDFRRQQRVVRVLADAVERLAQDPAESAEREGTWRRP